jgi:hypothetical protein
MFWSRLFPAGGLLLALALSATWAGSRASRVPSQESSLLPVSSFLSSATNSSARPQIIQSYGHLPLMFEPNVGQTDARVQFIARGTGYGLFLTKNGAVLSLLGGKSDADRTSSVIQMNLVGANSNAAPAGLDVLPGKSNYFLGNDPKRWHRSVSQYARVRYASV